ncbi:MAG: energy-coupling factor ABC transporter permease [Lachnospiraceae bacterium]|nr:energy-coupling factor ABC transporter permease [Lachnospiraceae bacterium]
MHMADALLAPTVAATMYVASGITTGVSVKNLKMDEQTSKLPVMGVMAAFVFAGQMINYTIPGTGSSGHLCGGMLLSSLLGPYAGFLSMVVILAIQGLFFADGGLMALGANCWNMAFYGCFIGYFLIYRPIMKKKGGNVRLRLTVASVLGCMLTLQLGAFSVCVETFASGISELPFGAFVGLMQPIHLAIGLVEGVITAAVLVFVYQTRPELLEVVGKDNSAEAKLSLKSAVAVLAVAAVLIAGIGSQFASGNPDGLEWSLFGNADGGYSANMGLDEEEYGVSSTIADAAASLQEKTAFLPDYAFANDEDNGVGTSVSGIVGGLMVTAVAVAICFLGGFFKKKKVRA